MVKCCERDHNNDGDCDVHKVPSKVQIMNKISELKEALEDDGAHVCDDDFMRFHGAIEALKWVLGKGEEPKEY